MPERPDDIERLSCGLDPLAAFHVFGDAIDKSEDEYEPRGSIADRININEYLMISVPSAGGAYRFRFSMYGDATRWLLDHFNLGQEIEEGVPTELHVILYEDHLELLNHLDETIVAPPGRADEWYLLFLAEFQRFQMIRAISQHEAVLLPDMLELARGNFRTILDGWMDQLQEMLYFRLSNTIFPLIWFAYPPHSSALDVSEGSCDLDVLIPASLLQDWGLMTLDEYHPYFIDHLQNIFSKGVQHPFFNRLTYGNDLFLDQVAFFGDPSTWTTYGLPIRISIKSGAHTLSEREPAPMNLSRLTSVGALYAEMPDGTIFAPFQDGSDCEVWQESLVVFSTVGGRVENQDAAVTYSFDDGTRVRVLADGMGGHDGGAKAAQANVLRLAHASSIDEAFPTLGMIHRAPMVGLEDREERGGSTLVDFTHRPHPIDSNFRQMTVNELGDSGVMVIDPDERFIVRMPYGNSHTRRRIWELRHAIGNDEMFNDYVRIGLKAGVLEGTRFTFLGDPSDLCEQSDERLEEFLRFLGNCNLGNEVLDWTDVYGRIHGSPISEAIDVPVGAVVIAMSDGVLDIMTVYEIAEFFYGRSFKEACRLFIDTLKERTQPGGSEFTTYLGPGMKLQVDLRGTHPDNTTVIIEQVV